MTPGREFTGLAVPLRGGARPPPGRVPRTVAALVVGTVVALLLSPVAALVGTLTSADASAASDHASRMAPAFSARAGFSADNAERAADVRPASGPLTVVVTLQPAGVALLPTRGTIGSAAGFADRYGPSPAALASTVRYFEAAGVRVAPVSPDRLTLALSGPALSFARAFRTTLETGTYEGRPVLFPTSAPSLPAALESGVAGVVGLTSGFSEVRFSLAPGLGGGPVTPAEARNAYNLTSLYNLSGLPRYPTGESIAVILWGDGYAPSDIAGFEAADYPSTFPLPKVVPYPIGNAPAPNNNATSAPDQMEVEELTLDIEWSMSMAPGATIDAIYAPRGPASQSYGPSDANLTLALSQALALNVTAISMSFGTPEASDAGLASAWGPLLSEARDRGITVLAATGDTGGDLNASCSGGPAADFPALSPNVTAVGGTDLNLSGPLGAIVSESAWNGSGGGFSTAVAAPSWQEVGSARAPIEANGHRGLPDVSATSADDGFYFAGRASQAAGTSFATPLWAGLVASMDAVSGLRLGWINALLYRVGAAEPTGQIGDGLVDITQGSTCLGSATTGWDVETGWGSPRAVLLYEDLVGSFVNLSMTVTPTTVAPGGTVVVRAVLENRSGVPISGTTVNVTLRGSPSIGPCSGLFDAGAATTNGTGGIAMALRVPYCYLGAHAIVNVSVITPNLYGALDRRVAVNLLGFVPGLEFLEVPPWNYLTFAVVIGGALGLGGWLGQGPAPDHRQRTAPAVPSAPGAPLTPVPPAPGPAEPAPPQPDRSPPENT